MAKTVIALIGREGSGKTETIREAACLFGEMRGIMSASFKVRGVPAEDIISVFSVYLAGFKVGFASSGDISRVIKKNLKVLRDCEIIVCAVSTGQTDNKETLKEWCETHDAKLTWVEQAVIDLHDEGNGYKTPATCVLVDGISRKRDKLMAELINWYVNAEIDKRNAQS